MTESQADSGNLTRIAPKEDLKKIFQCPSCLKVPWPPIYQCKRGHIICNRCRSKIPNCTLCPFGPPFTETRNYFMESIIEKSIFRCELSDEGCDVNLPGGELQKHLEICGFRPIQCHLGRKDGCNRAVIDFTKYTQHLIDVHNFNAVSAKPDGTFVLTHSFTLPYRPASNRSWKSFYVSFDGKTFIPRICTVGTIDMLKFHLAILGGIAEAAKYNVKIIFENKTKSQVPSYQFQLPIYAVRLSDKEASDLHQGILNYGALKDIGKIIKTSGNEEQFEWSVQYQISKTK